MYIGSRGGIPLVLITTLLAISSSPGIVFSQLDEKSVYSSIVHCWQAAQTVADTAGDPSITQEMKDKAAQFLNACDGFISAVKNKCQSDPSPSFCTKPGINDYVALRASK
jgi:hypothetical protein